MCLIGSRLRWESGCAISCRGGLTPGVKQKGAQKRAERPRPDHSPDARRDDHHRDPALVLLLRPYRPTGLCPDHGQPCETNPHCVINVGSGDVTLLITEQWTKETHQGFLSMIRSHWRGWTDRPLRGSSLTAHGPGQPRMGRRPRDRDPTVTQSDSGVERDGSPVETHQPANRGQPCHTIDRRIHAPCVPIHP